MRELETDWWYLSLPPDWQVEQDGDSIVIADPDELGVITITSLLSDGEQDIDLGLSEMMGNLDIDRAAVKPVTLGDFRGFYAEFEEGGDWVREWYLGSERCLLLISYDCALEDRDLDREMVDQILDTLSPK